MWRIARPAFAGVLGLGLVTVSGQGLGPNSGLRPTGTVPAPAPFFGVH